MKKHLFTLIELLITIAIIAILASMLLPSLNKARDRARAISCTGNLKQMGSAMMLYCDENNGWATSNHGDSITDGTYTITRRWDFNRRYRKLLGQADDGTAYFTKNMRCPSATGFMTSWERGPRIIMGRCYTMAKPNATFTSVYNYGTYRLTMICEPSRAYMISDGMIETATMMTSPTSDDGYFNQGMENLIGSKYPWPAPRHNLSYNSVHWDGHVSSKLHSAVTPNEIKYRSQRIVSGAGWEMKN